MTQWDARSAGVPCGRTWGSARTWATGPRTCRGRSTGSAATPEVIVVAVSPVYETAPVGGPVQPDYLNAVVAVDTDAHAARRCSSSRTGSKRKPTGSARCAGGPRTLDVDVLLVGDETVDEPDLVVPHPRMLERAFVLVPLADLDPEWAAWIPAQHADVRPTEIGLSLPK